MLNFLQCGSLQFSFCASRLLFFEILCENAWSKAFSFASARPGPEGFNIQSS
jgi:hypothetical protein